MVHFINQLASVYWPSKMFVNAVFIMTLPVLWTRPALNAFPLRDRSMTVLIILLELDNVPLMWVFFGEKAIALPWSYFSSRYGFEKKLGHSFA